MIGALRGTLHEKTPEYVIIDVGGVGYAVRMPLPWSSTTPLWSARSR